MPIVSGAILFDLAKGGDKDWGPASPYRSLGRDAMTCADVEFRLGNVSAGLGASAGHLKGGLGSASAVTDDAMQVGALVAVNAVGSTVIPGTRTLWSAMYEQQNEMGSPVRELPPGDLKLGADVKGFPRGNTTIAVVATNAVLHKNEVQRVAIMAHDGYAHAIRSVHTPFDGDTIFALATGT